LQAKTYNNNNKSTKNPIKNKIMTQEKIKEIKEQHGGAIVLVRTEKGYTLYGADARTLLYDVMDGDNDMLYDVYEDERLSNVSFRVERLDHFMPKLIRAGYKVVIYDNIKATEEVTDDDIQAMCNETIQEQHLQALTETESGQELIRQTAYLLIRKADEWCDEETYFQAVLLIGRSECIRYKFDNNLELDKQDKEYIRDRI
jgi:DNA mismatch repair ATPase MutS